MFSLTWVYSFSEMSKDLIEYITGLQCLATEHCNPHNTPRVDSAAVLTWPVALRVLLSCWVTHRGMSSSLVRNRVHQRTIANLADHLYSEYVNCNRRWVWQHALVIPGSGTREAEPKARLGYLQWGPGGRRVWTREFWGGYGYHCQRTKNKRSL